MTFTEQGFPPPGNTAIALLQQVRGYWEGLRNDGAVPKRADVDPRGMEQALAHVFLLERIAPGIAKFRLAGLHMTQLLRMEVRGMPLTTFFLPMSRSAAELLVEKVFLSPAIVDLSLEAAREIGCSRLEGRLLLLPLMDGGVCDKALGCFVTHGEIGRRPRRFGIVRQRTEILASAGPPFTAHADRTAQPEFAEPATPFRPKQPAQPSRGAPHLRLVKSSD